MGEKQIQDSAQMKKYSNDCPCPVNKEHDDKLIDS
jgi:hypothetical protein